jgi:hypothetical protein
MDNSAGDDEPHGRFEGDPQGVDLARFTHHEESRRGIGGRGKEDADTFALALGHKPTMKSLAGAVPTATTSCAVPRRCPGP